MVYLIVIILGMGVYAIFMPKRLTKAEIYATTFFALYFGLFADSVFDLHYHFYGYFKNNFDWPSVAFLHVMDCTVSALFLNYFPFKKTWAKKAFYILCWSIFASAYEYFAVKTPLFFYNGWKLRYSMVLYPPIFLLLIFNLCFFRFLLKKDELKIEEDTKR